MTDPYGELGGQPVTRLPPGMLRGCGKRWCNHIDDHRCPWRDLPDGRIEFCGCTHAPPVKTKGRR